MQDCSAQRHLASQEPHHNFRVRAREAFCLFHPMERRTADPAGSRPDPCLGLLAPSRTWWEPEGSYKGRAPAPSDKMLKPSRYEPRCFRPELWGWEQAAGSRSLSSSFLLPSFIVTWCPYGGKSARTPLDRLHPPFDAINSSTSRRRPTSRGYVHRS